jgi:hypothetical protein
MYVCWTSIYYRALDAQTPAECYWTDIPFLGRDLRICGQDWAARSSEPILVSVSEPANHFGATGKRAIADAH